MNKLSKNLHDCQFFTNVINIDGKFCLFNILKGMIYKKTFLFLVLLHSLFGLIIVVNYLLSSGHWCLGSPFLVSVGQLYFHRRHLLQFVEEEFFQGVGHYGHVLKKKYQVKMSKSWMPKKSLDNFCVD